MRTFYVYQLSLEMTRAVQFDRLRRDFDLTYDPIQLGVDNFICVTTMDRKTLEYNASRLPYYTGCAIINIESDDKDTFSPQQWRSITALVQQVEQAGGDVQF